MFLPERSNYHPRRFYPDFDFLATEHGRVSIEMGKGTLGVTTISLWIIVQYTWGSLI